MALHWVQVVVETSQNCEYCIVVYHYQLIKVERNWGALGCLNVTDIWDPVQSI
jgi:hypothetical protein